MGVGGGAQARRRARARATSFYVHARKGRRGSGADRKREIAMRHDFARVGNEAPRNARGIIGDHRLWPM